jgi:osmotically-inducible protein OsmY
MRRNFWRNLTLFGLGVLTGLLFAPKSGRNSRVWLRQQSEHLRSNVVHLSERLAKRARYERGRLEGLRHSLRERVGGARLQEAYVDDDLITQRVKTELGENPRTWRIASFNVNTVNGVVTLRGRVSSEEEREALEEVARSVPNVEDVINKVTVTKVA